MTTDDTHVANLDGRLVRLTEDDRQLTARVVGVDLARRSVALVTVPDGMTLLVDPSALRDCVVVPEPPRTPH